METHERIRTLLDDEANLLRGYVRVLGGVLQDTLAHPTQGRDRDQLCRVASEIAQGAARVTLLLELQAGLTERGDP